MNTSTRRLAEPLRVNEHHTLRNRIIMGSMHTGFEEHEQGAEHLAAFYRERARGGAALIITGGIAPNSEGAVVDDGATLEREDQLPWHRTVTAAVHEHGAKICMQILHTGRYALGRHPVAPSAIRAPINPATPRTLSTAEVKQLVRDYARCAQLAQQAGYDGVEIMGSEGYLINQFLAPATNQREDEYGGSLDNRQRLAEEIVAAVRAACGEDFLIIYRISLLDLVENGNTWEENRLLAAKIEAAGADMFNTGIGWQGFAARGSEKAVDILLLQLVIRRVELALDGMEITRTGLLSNQIDTIIPCRSKAVFRRPFRPCPYPRIQVLVSRLVAQVSKH